MSNGLIPQKRMDKTGKLVTRHVLATAPSPSHVKSIPAPSAKPSAKKKAVKKPLAKQLEVQTRMTNISALTPDNELLEAFGMNPEAPFPLVYVSASDVQLYDMFSVLSTSNAAMMVSHGKKTPEEATAFLESKGLDHLIVDRREMMDDAQSRRISAWSFVEAVNVFKVDEFSCDQEMLVNAIRLHSSVSLPRWKSGEDNDSYAHRVLNGSISYDDVMSFGISFLSERAALAPKICGYLNDIHEGRTDYDVKVLEHVVMKSRERPSILDDAMGMVGEYGPEFITEINSMDSALVIDREYRNRPTSQRADMIRYRRDGGFDFINLNTKEVVRLYDNNVPLDAARRLLKEDMTVEQIIGIHQGIAQPVASGWL